MPAPLCFVLMPFGKKPDATGRTVDFDAVYKSLLEPAVRAAGLEPLRADEEKAGGVIHRAMFERLLVCEYAVADLSTANANVFYELGVRHAARPFATVAVYAEGEAPKFDVNLLRLLPYRLGADGSPVDVGPAVAALTARLDDARRTTPVDSPVFELVKSWRPSPLPHDAADGFRDRVDIARGMKDELAAARAAKSPDAIRAFEAKLGDLSLADAGVVVDLFLSYRDVKGWADMVRVAKAMFQPVARSRMVREQVALALNRLGDSAAAERELKEVLKDGRSPETCGILGRVYKDRWDKARAAGDRIAANGHLNQALAAYREGFEADFRDAYPGVNAVTLAELVEPVADPIGAELLPVVTYAVKRKIASGKADYWDHATLVELAVLRRDQAGAESALADALAALKAGWEAETTANNLRLIRETRERRKSADAWANDVENELRRRVGP